MVTRILSAVVLAPLFFVVLFFLPPVFLAVLLACITARASFELLRATKVAHHNGMYVYTAAAAGLIREEKYGMMCAVINNEIVPVPLEEVAGKLKRVPAECSTVRMAREIGISFGD